MPINGQEGEQNHADTGKGDILQFVTIHRQTFSIAILVKRNPCVITTRIITQNITLRKKIVCTLIENEILQPCARYYNCKLPNPLRTSNLKLNV